MILDYTGNKEFALANGITSENDIGETYFKGNEVCKGITFRNFFNLCVESTVFEDCIFENCGNINTEGCRFNGCNFNNVNNIKGIRTAFDRCEFKNCCSDGPFIFIETLGFIDSCTFDTITTLGENGYIIYSVYRKNTEVERVTNCRFIDCQVETEDGKYCYCAYLKRSYSLIPVEIDNVDYETCDFGEGDAIEIGSFDLDVLEGDYDEIEIIGSFVSEDD